MSEADQGFLEELRAGKASLYDIDTDAEAYAGEEWAREELAGYCDRIASIQAELEQLGAELDAERRGKAKFLEKVRDVFPQFEV